MKIRPYLYVLSVFAASTAVAYGASQVHRHTIRDMIDTAGREDMPIVATLSEGAWQERLKLHSLDGSSVVLDPGMLACGSNSLSRGHSLFFTTGCRLWLVTSDRRGHTGDQWRIDLPDFRAELANPAESGVPSLRPSRGQRQRTERLGVGPEGKVIGVQYEYGGGYVAFHDGLTWKTLQSVSSATSPVVGERWAGCLEVTASGASAVLFDMDDGWRRHEIKLAPSWQNDCWESGLLALCEPGQPGSSEDASGDP